MGAAGTSISFADENDAFYSPAIEDFIDRKLVCVTPADDWLTTGGCCREHQDRCESDSDCCPNLKCEGKPGAMSCKKR